MADQIYDPRLETLLRESLATEVAKLPLTVEPDHVFARRGARNRSGTRFLDVGHPTAGRRRLSMSLGAVAVLAVAIVALRLSTAPDRVDPAAALPATPDAWSRVVLDAGPNAQDVTSLAASPRGLLAVVGVDDGPDELFASTDGYTWTRVPPDEHPAIGVNGTGWALVGSDRGYLLSNGDVWFSEDGFDWQLLASRSESPDLGHGEMHGVAAGGPGYVAVGNGNSAWYSTDGSDWSLAQVPPPPTEFFESRGYAAPEVDMRGLAVAGDRLVAWGTASRHTEVSGLTSPVMWTSQDGRSWTNALDPSDGEGPNAMAAGLGGFAGVFDDTGQLVVRVATDGSTWEQVADLGAARSEDTDGMPLDLEVSGIAASDAGFVAAGGFGPRCLMAGVPCGPDEAMIWTSADGRSWSRLPKAEQFAHAGASDIVSWGDRFVIGGAQDGQPVIWISGSETPAGGARAPFAAQGTPAVAPGEEPSPASPPRDGRRAAFAGSWEATDPRRTAAT